MEHLDERPVQVLALLEKLDERLLEPSAETYVAACASCSLAAWERSLQLLEQALQRGLASGRSFAAAVAAAGDRWELVLQALVSMRALRLMPAKRTSLSLRA